MRQQCARALVDAIQDRSPRIAAQELSLGNPLLCMDWSDSAAFTLPPTLSHSGATRKTASHGIALDGRHHGDLHKHAMRSTGGHAKVAMKLFWRWIVSTSNFDQVRTHPLHLPVSSLSVWLRRDRL